MIKTNDEYLDSEKFRKLLAEYEQSVKSGSPLFMEADDLTDIAQYYSFMEEWDKASDVISYAISIHPGAVSPIVFKARIALLKEENPEKAERITETIEDKTDLDYFYIKAEILIVQERVDDADDYLLARLEDVSSEDKNDFILDVANLYEDYEQFEKVSEWLKRSHDDDSLEFKELMARSLFQTGHLEESKERFNELIDKNPYSTKYWKSLSIIQLLGGDINEAVSCLEYALAINPNDADAVRSKAECLLKLDNHEEALTLFERYAQLRPKDETGEMMIGICYFNLQKYPEAVTHLKKAEQQAYDIADETNLPQIYQELAFSLNECDQLDEAIAYINKTQSMENSHIETNVLKGHLYLSKHEVELAMDCFQQALSESKSAPDVLLHISVSILDNRYIKKAYELFKELFKVTGSDWNKGYSHMALCCKELGKDEEFLEYLKKAAEVNPEEAKEVLGDMFPDDMDSKDYFYYMYNKLNPQN